MAELKTNEVTPPRVRVSIGYTKNMDNFESLRYDIAVESSALPGESTNAAYERVSEFVEQRLLSKMAELETDLKDS